MAHPHTIQGELRLPGAFLQGQPMEVIERQLQTCGLLPARVETLRWRMDHEHPGGYILMFTLAVSACQEQPPA